MRTYIYCKVTEKGVHSFFLETQEGEFFLFNQSYRKGVQAYFGKGVSLTESRNFAKSNHDSAIIKTMNKLPAYIRYVEKEYGVLVLDQTKKRYQVRAEKVRRCA